MNQDAKAKRLANLRPWKPGQSGNPKGGKGLPADIREARRMNIEDLERYLNKYLHMPPALIKAEIDKPDTTAIEAMIGMIVTAAIVGADHQRLDFLLTRLIGKVPDKIETKGEITMRTLPSVDEARRILAADPAAEDHGTITVTPLEEEPTST